MKNFTNITFVFTFALLGIMLLLEFDICKNAVSNGILLCSNVIIPSLFPFSVCAIFLINSNIFSKIPFLNILGKPFKLNAEEFTVLLLSLVGGYPIGGKMVSRLYENKKITLKKARYMTCYCVNAGPSFIISFIGSALLNNRNIGVILFFSHILTSFILAYIYGFKIEFSTKTTENIPRVSSVDNFVISTTQASEAIINICFFVIFFSVITSYAEHFSECIPFLKYFSLLLEITLGVKNTKNLYSISFLLGFAGICIWLQVFSATKKCKPSIFLFAFSRVFHGFLSFILTFVLLKISKLNNMVFSNIIFFEKKFFYGTKTLSISIFILVLFFLITLSFKKYSGNISEDLL